VLTLVYLLAFHYGLGDSFPFSLVTSLCKQMFGRRFFTLMAPRRPNQRTLLFGMYKCTEVESLVEVKDPKATMMMAGGDRNQTAGGAAVRLSEELPLTEV